QKNIVGRTMPATRRRAAILAADVVGYSRLIGDDEDGTLARLKTLRAELIDPRIAERRGRIVKTTGDGMLVEFGSVGDCCMGHPEWAPSRHSRSAPHSKAVAR